MARWEYSRASNVNVVACASLYCRVLIGTIADTHAYAFDALFWFFMFFRR